MTESARDLYSAGRLADAIEAATAEVRGRPTDQSARGFLAELLCLNGDVERADKQLDVLGTQDDKALPALVQIRHVLRAEQARQQFFNEGRVPEFFDQPSSAMRHCLEASIAFREGQFAEAAELVSKAEAERVPARGTCDGEAFTDFRDLDDMTAGFFEVLTGKGDYYWVPFERVERLEFRAPARPRDLLWRRALMTVRDGPDGEVYLPAIYPLSYQEEDEGLRLGRATDWKQLDGGLVRGLGLRSYLVGEESRTIMELAELTFEPVAH
jgi:type VI secretion system protein ImpE